MEYKYICEECLQETPQQEYELQDFVFCPECGGRMNKLSSGKAPEEVRRQVPLKEAPQKSAQEGTKKQVASTLKGVVLFMAFVLSAILTYNSISSLYLYSFSANQAMLLVGIMIFSGMFAGVTLSLIRWFLVRANKVPGKYLFRLMQTVAVLAAALFVPGIAVDGSIKHNLKVTENTYLPVIQSIENAVTGSGNPPADILTVLSSINPETVKYFPRSVYYYRDDNSYSLSIAAGSADMDGSTNYWDSQKSRWVKVHNDSLQRPESSVEAGTFIQSYQSLPIIVYVYEKGEWMSKEEQQQQE